MSIFDATSKSARDKIESSPAMARLRSASSTGANAGFIEVLEQIIGVLVNAIRSSALEFVLTISSGKNADPECPSAALPISPRHYLQLPRSCECPLLLRPEGKTRALTGFRLKAVVGL